MDPANWFGKVILVFPWCYGILGSEPNRAPCSSEKLQQRIVWKSELSLESSRIIDRIQRESDSQVTPINTTSRPQSFWHPPFIPWDSWVNFVGANDVCYLKRLVITPQKKDICRGIVRFQSFDSIPLFKMGKCIIPCQVLPKIPKFPPPRPKPQHLSVREFLRLWSFGTWCFGCRSRKPVWSLGLC